MVEICNRNKRIFYPLTWGLHDDDCHAPREPGKWGQSGGKQLKGVHSGVDGKQFQLKKRWIFRTEGDVIGDRKSFLASVN